MKIVDYTIITEKNETHSLFKFQNEVRRFIEEGWQPLGAPHIVGGSLHMQAMVLPNKVLKKFKKRMSEQTGSTGP